ncbi:NAD(P)H-dependent oxidoreductase [Clostridium sp. OS1-26]|uniref:NAD(P)H-dependent oxidoreductase n=1 Tax=Clostridium sp. OS1-26 TaxID=3070681 RepID=UPI0027E1C859|nr:NAD(P)H-dependent oxidoreductase [Clostridium sp. OS1-26]WML34607.1 NAD(P)H-dependent oxidoreductase [Clostridium sp. OS1-26]
MNHLIIYAHPSSASFSNAILEKVKECSMKKGCKTEVRDLYSIGFDPILRAVDFEGLCGGNTPEDIKREQNYIEWADLITFIYPIWWTGMPAILKGYIDRVFSYELAAQQESNDQKQQSRDSKQNSSKQNSSEKSDSNNEESGNSNQKKDGSTNEQKGSSDLLKDKKVIIVTPMGTSCETYDNYGMTNSMQQTCDVGIFSFCGMKVIQHKFLGGVPNVDDKVREGYLQELCNMFNEILN